jgi:hypothetical protein
MGEGFMRCGNGRLGRHMNRIHPLTPKPATDILHARYNLRMGRGSIVEQGFNADIP